VFVFAAVDSYVEDLIVVAVSFLVGVPLMISVSKLKILDKSQRIVKTKEDL